MDAIVVRREIDGRHRSITTFVVYDAVVALEQLDEGEVLAVVTDDDEPFRADIAAWCRATGHRLLDVEPTSEGLRFLIEKRAANPKTTKMALVISNDGLEELLSPLGFALAAALEGMEVHLYFQGPAVQVLTPEYRPKLSGWARPFSRIAAKSLDTAGHIAAQDKLRQLRALGARIYLCGPSMQHFKVDRDELIFDDLPVVEYLTFVAVMEQADISMYT